MSILPILTAGTVLFIPKQGIYTVSGVTNETAAGHTYQQCRLTHRFSGQLITQSVAGLERSNVREPTKLATAADIVKRLNEPPRSVLTGPWNKQKTKLDEWLHQGTLEKNLRVVRYLHRIDQDRWRAARAEYYNCALQYMVEEVAHIFGEPLPTTRQKLLRTLNNAALQQLHS